VFDGSEDDDDIEGSRLPLLIVLALLVLAMFGGVVWLAYTQGVARGRTETPILAAAGGPERVAPTQAGGSNVPYQGFKIYEQPAPSDDSADAGPAKSQTPPPVQAETPKPVETPKPAPVQTAVAPKPIETPKPTPVQTAAAPKPAAPAPAKPAAAPATPPKSMAALIQQSNSAPAKPAAKSPPPAMKPAVSNPPAAPSNVATAAPRPLGGPQKVAAATPPAPAAASAGGAYVLQIGAYKSQADAESAWKTYKSRHTALLSGYSDDIRQVELGEKGTWYRLRIGGLSDREVAAALCDRLKSDGGACMLSK
jgi:cell division septation protein DedD